MTASPEQTLAAMRALYCRTSAEIVSDLRSVAHVLARELDELTDPPLPTALSTIETSAEGLRRLLIEHRIALQAIRTLEAA
jgi:hypothetical protein